MAHRLDAAKLSSFVRTFCGWVRETSVRYILNQIIDPNSEVIKIHPVQDFFAISKGKEPCVLTEGGVFYAKNKRKIEKITCDTARRT